MRSKFSVLIVSFVLFTMTTTVFSQGDYNKTELDSTIYVTVEQMPQFPGGDGEMMKFIMNNIKFPGAKCSTSSRAVVRFIVDRDGNVTKPEIIRSFDYAKYDTAFLEVVNQTPKWLPGKQNGKNVAVYYLLPINIHLSVK